MEIYIPEFTIGACGGMLFVTILEAVLIFLYNRYTARQRKKAMEELTKKVKNTLDATVIENTKSSGRPN